MYRSSLIASALARHSGCSSSPYLRALLWFKCLKDSIRQPRLSKKLLEILRVAASDKVHDNRDKCFTGTEQSSLGFPASPNPKSVASSQPTSFCQLERYSCHAGRASSVSFADYSVCLISYFFPSIFQRSCREGAENPQSPHYALRAKDKASAAQRTTVHRTWKRTAPRS